MVLSAEAPSFGVFETLTQYGALGVVVLGLGAVLWFMLKILKFVQNALFRTLLYLIWKLFIVFEVLYDFLTLKVF